MRCRDIGLGALAGLWFATAPATVVADARQPHGLQPSMIGKWGWSAESCAKADDDGQVTISMKSVAFFASAYNLRKVVARADGSLHVIAATSEEGEAGTSTGVIDLKQLTPRTLSIRTAAAGRHVYVRCREQPRE
jgi:hypothetical protein